MAQIRFRLCRLGKRRISPANARLEAPKPRISWLAVELAAVLTVSNVGTAAVPDTLTLAGLKLQLEFAGRPVQAKVSAPEKPAAPVTLMGALTV
jgi:hypothetical protein